MTVVVLLKDRGPPATNVVWWIAIALKESSCTCTNCGLNSQVCEKFSLSYGLYISRIQTNPSRLRPVTLNKRLNIQRRLAWSLCKDDTHNRRERSTFFAVLSSLRLHYHFHLSMQTIVDAGFPFDKKIWTWLGDIGLFWANTRWRLPASLCYAGPQVQIM